MIDLKSIESELQYARMARIEAESASTDVEDLIVQVQHFVPGRGRLCFFIDGMEAEEAPQQAN
jgi:hypothetical protein